MLGFASRALVESAAGDEVVLSESAASAYEAIGPDEASQAGAAPVVGAVALDEAGVEAGQVVDGALEGYHTLEPATVPTVNQRITGPRNAKQYRAVQSQATARSVRTGQRPPMASPHPESPLIRPAHPLAGDPLPWLVELDS